LLIVGGRRFHSVLERREVIEMTARAALAIVCFGIGIISPAYSAYESVGRHTLAGIVVDAKTERPLSGAYVTLVEFNRRCNTDDQGRFLFSNLPKGDFTVAVYMPGYQTESVFLNIPGSGEVRVALSAGGRLHDEITVSATPWADDRLHVPQQIDSLPEDEIRLSADGSVADVVRSVPGVRTAYTGGSTSKPVIRGLTDNRIQVLNDGIAVAYQQFGIRHQPNVEVLGTDRIEVLRGPASVLYGADAMGGIVNIVQAPLPTAESGRPMTIHGTLFGDLSGNTGGGTGFLRLEGTCKGLGWRGSLIRRSLGDIRTPTATLDNTAFHQTNGDAAVGYTGLRGSIRVRWHHWTNAAGFFRPEGFQVRLKDDLIAADAFLTSRWGDFEIEGGHQTNNRKAFSRSSGNRPQVNLDLDSNVFLVRMHHRSFGPLRGAVAAQINFQKNIPRAEGKLLPKYTELAWSLSIFEQAAFDDQSLDDRWVVNMALRYDRKSMDVAPDQLRDIPFGCQRSWSTVTASASLLYRLSQGLSLAGSLGKGWRSPSVFDLFANGVHGGVGAVQLGEPTLRQETNVNSELSLRWSRPRATGYLTLFNNAFQDYIYLANTGMMEGELPVFRYRQADAWLRGVEAKVAVVLSDGLTTSAGIDYLETRNRSTDRRLPLTPPARLNWTTHWEHDLPKSLSQIHTELEVEWNGAGRVSGPEEPFPFETGSYTLLKWTGGIRRDAGDGTSLGLDLSISNLLNLRYRDFLYTYKEEADMPGRGIRVTAHVAF
jgi:outer membrane receptor protein involved in Fe transport